MQPFRGSYNHDSPAGGSRVHTRGRKCCKKSIIINVMRGEINRSDCI
jgi:hypothetical protein